MASRFARQANKAIRANISSNESKIVLLRAFVGGSRQDEQFMTSLSHAASDLSKDHGITLTYEVLNNKEVKEELKWTVTKLVDWLLASDVHLVPCHMHQGNLGKTSSWNVDNVQANSQRLKNHLGLPMGRNVDCAVWQLDKYRIYKKTEGFSTPTMMIPLQPDILCSTIELNKIKT